MSRRLILTRHAKSSWNSPGLGDHERPLNRRGQASAKALGKWLAGHGYLPDEALVSTATRTRQTWEGIATALPHPPLPEFRRELYLADPEEMLDVLRGAVGDCVIMVGHNPGTAWLAQGLAATPPGDPRFSRYPTATTTVLDFEVEAWHELRGQRGRVVDFVVPRDLL